MPVTKEELQERAQLVRLYEASVKTEYPTIDELNARIAILKRIGVAFNLREMRTVSVTGPVTQAPGRPAAPATKRS